MSALLDKVGRGVLDIEDGFALPPSEEGLAYCGDLLRRACERDPEAWSPEEVEECGRDLVAYVVTYLDEGWTIAQAVESWAQEWDLLDE